MIAIMVSSVRPHRRDVKPKPPNAMNNLRGVNRDTKK